jgi:branched-chain amino acid transport system ATP-binding protein
VTAGRPLLEVRGLTKRYFGLTAVAELSYQVEAGSIVGLIGPNGSGKSTSIDCISGFQRVDAGEWFLDGRPMAGLPPHGVARLGLTRTFQTVRAYDELSLLENLCVASQETDGSGWIASLRRSAAVREKEVRARSRGQALLASVGLAQYAHAPAAILSYGQRKLFGNPG